MNITTLTNSVKGLVWEAEGGMTSVDDVTKQIVMVLLVETWSHKSTESVFMEHMTDLEYRILDMWARQNAHQYSSRISMIKDMRETFPGLTLSGANHFAKGLV